MEGISMIVDIKTSEDQLKQEFIQGYGYPSQIAEALVLPVRL
jgi:hypothetical protein